MRKSMMVAAALCCMTMSVFTSCTNDDNPVPNGGKAVITVNTVALYDELNITDLMQESLKGDLSIIDSVLIYDEAGNLLKKLGAESKTLEPLTIEAGNLPNGTYTLVAWQTTPNDDGKIAWVLSGEDQLSTVSLSTDYDTFFYTRSLGYASATVTVDGGSIEASVSPKAMGSIIELRIDNLTKDTGYNGITLRGENSQYIIGCRLDPSLTDEDRYIMEREHNWVETVGKFDVGTDSYKFFTLTHGDDVRFTLYGVKEDKSREELFKGYHSYAPGESLIYYFDMNRLGSQPAFFGTYEDFADWKADRDAGILVFNPCLEWGCTVDDVEQYISTTHHWYNEDEEVYYNEVWNTWRKRYYVASLMAEEYEFDTEDGQNMNYVFCYCEDPTVPYDKSVNDLLEQGYVYSGQIQFPDDEPFDIYFSADGNIEVFVIIYEDNTWEIDYQPTDPDDFQYIIPANEAPSRTMVKNYQLPALRRTHALRSK